MRCPRCHSATTEHWEYPDLSWIWGLEWMSIKAFEVIAGEEYFWNCYKLSNKHHLKEPRKRFMRLRYACRCIRCDFEWDIITSGDLNELS